MNKGKRRLNTNVNNNLRKKRSKHCLNGKEKPLPSFSDLERMCGESDSKSTSSDDEIKKIDKKLRNKLLETSLNGCTDDVIIIDDDIPYQIKNVANKDTNMLRNDDDITIVSETPIKNTNSGSPCTIISDCITIVSETFPNGTKFEHNSVNTNMSRTGIQSNTYYDDSVTIVSEILPSGTNIENITIDLEDNTSRNVDQTNTHNDSITVISENPPKLSNIKSNLANNNTNISKKDNKTHNKVNTCNDSTTIDSERDTDTPGSDSTIIYTVNTSSHSFSPLPSTSRDDVIISENDKIFNNSLFVNMKSQNNPSRSTEKPIVVQDCNVLRTIETKSLGEIHNNCDDDYDTDFNERDQLCVIIGDSSIEDLTAENASHLSNTRKYGNFHNLIELSPIQINNTPNTNRSINMLNNISKYSSQKKKLKKKGKSQSPKANSCFGESHQCPICLDDVTSTNCASTICGHIFCMDCITCAIKQYRKCPTCRKTLKKGGYHRLFL